MYIVGIFYSSRHKSKLAPYSNAFRTKIICFIYLDLIIILLFYNIAKTLSFPLINQKLNKYQAQSNDISHE